MIVGDDEREGVRESEGKVRVEGREETTSIIFRKGWL